MSEQETEEQNSSKKTYPTPLKRLILTVIALFVFITIGEIAPRFLFEKKEKPAENVEKKSENNLDKIESDKAANPVDNPETEKTVNTENIPTATPSSEVSETIISKAETPKVAVVPDKEPEQAPPITTESHNSEPVPAKTEDTEHLRALEEKITALQAAHKTEISELKKNLETKNIDSQNKVDSVIASLIVFSQLKDAVNAGLPYTKELEQIKNLALNTPDVRKIISQIETDATTGIVTPAKLKEEFTTLIKQALIKNDESWPLKILHRFITIRKVGEQSGDSDEAILARAELKLAQYNFTSALNELEKLSPQTKEIFYAWQEKAKKMLDTQNTLVNLQLLLTQKATVEQP